MSLISFFIAAASAAGYFVLQEGIWVLAGLFLITLLTRFRSRTQNLGKFVEILFVFFIIFFIINDLGISYPYSLIIILTGLVGLIFYAGPEWSKLFFAPGETKSYFKLSLMIAAACVAVFSILVYFRNADITNPVPTEWPFDALIIAGIGFAFYKAVVEEMIFRSFIFERAQSAAGPTMAIPIQGTFYGLMFYRTGTPAGIEGALFGSLLGLSLGYLVHKTKSIYLSMLVQFLVTFGIFCALAIVG